MNRPDKTSFNTANKFRNLLASIDFEDFFGKKFGKNVCVIKDDKSRFVELFNWADCDELLRLDPTSVSFFRNEQAVPLETQSAELHGRTGRPCSFFDVRRLADQLQKGGQLAFRQIDRHSSEINNLAWDMRNIFLSEINADVYASFHLESSMTIPHWHTDDLFVVQLSGRMYWCFWKQIDDSPLEDPSDDPEMRSKVVWEGEVGPGDVIYMPRGTRHSVKTAGAPSLQLALGIKNHTGFNVLESTLRRLRENIITRVDIPVLEDEATMEEYLRDFKQAVSSVLTDKFLDDYLERQVSAIPPRQTQSLSALAGQIDDLLER